MAVCVIKVRRGMVAIFGYTKLEFVTLFYRIQKEPAYLAGSFWVLTAIATIS